MKGSQRMLILIVAGVILLVIVAFVAVLRRPPPEYTDDDSPEGVVHNYLLALQRREYERAYGYLSPALQTGDLVDFIEAVESDAWRFDIGSNVALAVSDSQLSADNAARVEVQMTVSHNELFGSGQNTRTFDMFLRRVDGRWLLAGGEAYWDECWDEDSNCRIRPQTSLGPQPVVPGNSGP